MSRSLDDGLLHRHDPLSDIVDVRGNVMRRVPELRERAAQASQLDHGAGREREPSSTEKAGNGEPTERFHD